MYSAGNNPLTDLRQQDLSYSPFRQSVKTTRHFYLYGQ